MRVDISIPTIISDMPVTHHLLFFAVAHSVIIVIKYIPIVIGIVGIISNKLVRIWSTIAKCSISYNVRDFAKFGGGIMCAPALTTAKLGWSEPKANVTAKSLLYDENEFFNSLLYLLGKVRLLF